MTSLTITVAWVKRGRTLADAIRQQTVAYHTAQGQAASSCNHMAHLLLPNKSGAFGNCACGASVVSVSVWRFRVAGVFVFALCHSPNLFILSIRQSLSSALGICYGPRYIQCFAVIAAETSALFCCDPVITQFLHNSIRTYVELEKYNLTAGLLCGTSHATARSHFFSSLARR